ncbi:hypothetical protein BH20ACT1_BH20ACT1_08060 [soil metagenome]
MAVDGLDLDVPSGCFFGLVGPNGAIERGATVVLSSHVMDLVERLCDQVAVMHAGRVVAAGRLDDVRDGRSLEDAFVDLVGARDLDKGALGWFGPSPV